MATFSFDPQITDEWLNALTLFLIPGMKLVSFHCFVVLHIADFAKLALQAVGVFCGLHWDNHIWRPVLWDCGGWSVARLLRVCSSDKNLIQKYTNSGWHFHQKLWGQVCENLLLWSLIVSLKREHQASLRWSDRKKMFKKTSPVTILTPYWMLSLYMCVKEHTD